MAWSALGKINTAWNYFSKTFRASKILMSPFSSFEAKNFSINCVLEFLLRQPPPLLGRRPLSFSALCDRINRRV